MCTACSEDMLLGYAILNSLRSGITCRCNIYISQKLPFERMGCPGLYQSLWILSGPDLMSIKLQQQLAAEAALEDSKREEGSCISGPENQYHIKLVAQGALCLAAIHNRVLCMCPQTFALSHTSQCSHHHTQKVQSEPKTSDTRHEFRRTLHEYYTTPSGIGEGVQNKQKRGSYF